MMFDREKTDPNYEHQVNLAFRQLDHNSRIRKEEGILGVQDPQVRVAYRLLQAGAGFLNRYHNEEMSAEKGQFKQVSARDKLDRLRAHLLNLDNSFFKRFFDSDYFDEFRGPLVIENSHLIQSVNIFIQLRTVKGQESIYDILNFIIPSVLNVCRYGGESEAYDVKNFAHDLKDIKSSAIGLVSTQIAQTDKLADRTGIQSIRAALIRLKSRGDFKPQEQTEF